MNARLFHVLHDPRHINPLAIGNGVHIDLDGVLEILVEEDRIVLRYGQRLVDAVQPLVGEPLKISVHLLRVVQDVHRPATENIGRPHHQGIADGRANVLRLFPRRGGPVRRLSQPEIAQQRLELLPILGQVDGIGGRSEDGDTGTARARASLSGVCPPNCTITPSKVPRDCSTRKTSMTSSSVNGSK